ncbi:MAG: hypothetical protein KGS45_09555 [Planctomycetes bacterium]|nr:hypothetical protein [Planctomycetota bacterium]
MNQNPLVVLITLANVVASVEDSGDFRFIESPPSFGQFQVIGISGDGTTVLGNGTTQPVVWRSASNAAVAIGSFNSASIRTFGSDISGDGTTIVGWSEQPASLYVGWRWRESTGIRQIPNTTGMQTIPRAVNETGSIIYGVGSFPWRWSSTEGIVSLPAVLGSPIESIGDCDSLGLAAVGNAGQWGYLIQGSTISALTQNAACRAEGFCISADGTSVYGTIQCSGSSRPQCFLDRAGQDRRVLTSPEFVEFVVVKCSADGGIAIGRGLTSLGTEGVIQLPSGRIAILKDHLRCRGLEIPSGCRQVVANAISNNGRFLAGSLITAQGEYRAWWVDLGNVTECLADYNADCSVDFFDYLDFVEVFAGMDLRADFNRDGTVDLFDYLDFLIEFTRPC